MIRIKEKLAHYTWDIAYGTYADYLLHHTNMLEFILLTPWDRHLLLISRNMTIPYYINL